MSSFTPTIRLDERKLTGVIGEEMKNLQQYQWIVFSAQTGFERSFRFLGESDAMRGHWPDASLVRWLPYKQKCCRVRHSS